MSQKIRLLLGSSLLSVTLSGAFAASSDNPFEDLDPVPSPLTVVEICGGLNPDKQLHVTGQELSNSKYSGSLAGLADGNSGFFKNSDGLYVIPGMTRDDLSYVLMTIRCNRSPEITFQRFSDRLNNIKDDTARDNFAVTCLHDLHLFDACKPKSYKPMDKIPDIFAGNQTEAKVGRYIRVKDSQDKWYPAKILSRGSGNNEVKIHYHGWDNKFDEYIDLKSARIEFYAGISSILKDSKWLEKHPLSGVDLPGLLKLACQHKQQSSHENLYDQILKEYPNPKQEQLFWDSWDDQLVID